LLVLDLYGRIRHQEWIRYGYIDALNLIVVTARIILIAAAIAANIERRLFVRRHAVVLVQTTVILRHAAATRVLIAIMKVDVPWIDDSLLEVIRTDLV